MKKTRRILIILLVLVLSCFNVINVYATQSTVPDVNYYKPTEEEVSNEVLDVAGGIVSLLQVLGTVIAVITIMIMGIKYMAGSVEEKADYKKTMIPYLIGVFIFFSLSQIIPMLIEFGSSLNT